VNSWQPKHGSMKILITGYTGLGNFVLKTPLIRAIYQQCEEPEIDLLMGAPWGAEKVLEHSEMVSSMMWLPYEASLFKKIHFIWKLRKKNYDLLFFPFDSTPGFVFILSVLFLKKTLITAHVNVYHLTSGQSIKNSLLLMLFRKVNWVPVLHGRNEVDLNLDLLDSISYQFYTENRDRSTVVTYARDTEYKIFPEKYIVLQPSARNGVATPKTWPLQSYISLIDLVEEKHQGINFVLVGDAGDLSAIQDSSIVTKRSVINLVGKTSFSQLCEVIKLATVVVANDSGVMHVANAIGVPLIALFGPTDYTRTKPLGKSTRVLYSRNECLCGFYAFQAGEDDILRQYPKDYCMREITAGHVFSEIETILSQ
jgi:ADP-heptose:LPS heptosyltransferase